MLKVRHAVLNPANPLILPVRIYRGSADLDTLHIALRWSAVLGPIALLQTYRSAGAKSNLFSRFTLRHVAPLGLRSVVAELLFL